MPEKKNILDSVIIMKIKYSRKTNIVLLSVVSTVIMLYTLTFLFGIREVKLGDEAKLHKFYDNANACYRDSGIILLNRLDLFVKQTAMWNIISGIYWENDFCGEIYDGFIAHLDIIPKNGIIQRLWSFSVGAVGILCCRFDNFFGFIRIPDVID